MRLVFKRFHKTGTYDADVTFCGTVFQSPEAATGKVRSSMVEKRVRQTISDDDDDDDRHNFRNVYTHIK